MNFQEFLAAKRAMALVEHMDTLSEQDALDLFNSLDEQTISFIEQVLDEGNLPKPLQRTDPSPGVQRFEHLPAYSGQSKVNVFGEKISKFSRMLQNAKNRFSAAGDRKRRMMQTDTTPPRGMPSNQVAPRGVKQKNWDRAQRAENKAMGQIVNYNQQLN